MLRWLFLFAERAGKRSGEVGILKVFGELINGDIKAIRNRGGITAGIKFHGQLFAVRIFGGLVNRLQSFHGESEREMLHILFDGNDFKDIQTFRSIHDREKTAFLAFEVHGQIAGSTVCRHGQTSDADFAGIIGGDCKADVQRSVQRERYRRDGSTIRAATAATSLRVISSSGRKAPIALPVKMPAR